MCVRLKQLGISIHAPHAGSDMVIERCLDFIYISIHAPHAGSDCWIIEQIKKLIHFYPRSPCGERLRVSLRSNIYLIFLSTLPMRGATDVLQLRQLDQKDFYPRSPCGERRIVPVKHVLDKPISIHAPHAGSD